MYASADGISRLMLKGPLLVNHSVPAIVQSAAASSSSSSSSTPAAVTTTTTTTTTATDTAVILSVLSGDSIHVCKWVYEHAVGKPCSVSRSETVGLGNVFNIFDAREEAEICANYWSNIITKPFYGAIMDRDNAAEMHFNDLIVGLRQFGYALKGPYFYGDKLSLIDVAILPFAYRIFTLNLFSTYRSEEIGDEGMSCIRGAITSAERDTDRDTDTDTGIYTGVDVGLHRLVRWLNVCMAQKWFSDTLPADAVAPCTSSSSSSSSSSNSPYFSQKLSDLYLIYAMGVGLKGVDWVAKL
jgi:hypothetical protein